MSERSSASSGDDDATANSHSLNGIGARSATNRGYEVTRRTMITAGIWSAPVLTAAVAMPMAAASENGARATLAWAPTSVTVSQSTATLVVTIPSGWEGVDKSGYVVIRGMPYYNVRTISSSWAPRLNFPNIEQAYFSDPGESRLPSGRFEFVVDFPVWNPEDAALGSASASLIYWDPVTSSSVVTPAPELPLTGY
ncbi:hypothetical protein [Pseudoclavibacter sp. RFBG4]|uniref:hypothetical protein n=1 Tax=Pseudoclavibacter sp. RFBG4 TaxID=2080575 RepID=UPI0011B004C9|nr:hypothetical protein [Pseudoclavibacter sp. RFBG4]